MDLAELRQFTGSESFFRHMSGNIYTEGVQYLAEQAGCYWLIDAICSHLSHNKKLQKEFRKDPDLKRLNFWVLTPTKNKGATLSCHVDSGTPPVITQIIPFTDFPFEDEKPFKLFAGYNGKGYTVYLPSEH